MRSILPVLLLVLGLAGLSTAESVQGEIRMQFDLSAHSADQPTDLWIPYPVSDANQTISHVRVEGDYDASAVYTDRKHGTPMLHARWNAGSEGRMLHLAFHAEREAQRIENLKDPRADWDPADYAVYLEATGLAPFNKEITGLAKEITKGKKGVLEKARAVYDWTVENTYRNPDTRGCGSGDVCKLLEDPGGKCADISSVYIALARAAGVPCREVFGIRMGRDEYQDISTWQHCWAEFYLPGKGWIPVDPADVRKAMLKEDIELDNPRTDELRAFFWAGLDAYRIRLSEGRDLQLAPPQQGEAINYLMYPYAQIGGTTLDWLDPKSFQYQIEYSRDGGYGLAAPSGN